MRELAVVQQGLVIGKESERFIITNKEDKEVITEIKSHEVDSISIYGNNQITTQAITLAFNKGIDISFINLSGDLKGKITSTISKNVYLRLKQYKIYENEEFKVAISKAIIKNKILNQYNLLKYHKIKEEEFIKISKSLDRATTINEIMGYEGMASKIYFKTLSKIVPKDFEFKGRSRRPPKDEFNALISLTYQIFLNKLTSNLEIQGLDTTLGMLHSVKYGRESLSLDILEEFRQSFCDPFVIKLLNRKQIKKCDFEIRDDGGYYLKEEPLKKYIKNFKLEYENIEKVVKEKSILIRTAIEEADSGIYIPYTFSKRR